MNKKGKLVVCILLILVLLISAFIGAVVVFFKSSKTGTVFVDTKCYTEADLFLDPYMISLHVPLIRTLQCLGYEITRENESVVLICDNDACYTLDLNACILYKNSESTMNLLEREPGPPRYRYCEPYEGEVYMDIESFRVTYGMMASDYWIVHLKRLQVVFFIPRQ